MLFLLNLAPQTLQVSRDLGKMFMYINTAIPCKQLPYKGLSIVLVLEAGLEPARRLNAKGF